MELYQKIKHIGVFDNIGIERKRIILLNIFCLTWALCIIAFMVLDPFFGQSLKKSMLIHSFSMSSIVLIFYLQKNRKYIAARTLLIIALIIVTFIFAIFIEPSRLMENFYFLYPLVSLVFIDKKSITISISIFCWFLYCLPFLFLTDLYPKGTQNPILILSVFIGTYVILNYSQKLNIESENALSKNKKDLEIAYLELEKRKQNELALLQLKSLKAQMNPHFMFNAMNSIQNLVLKGDKHLAYDYLTKFSSLIRENLNMSEKSFISIDEEISLLTKYLELEKLRFQENFEYKLLVSDTIRDIKIPSMIIQPFIENALKHGLLHKTNGTKRVEIKFEIHKTLECTITDNGIGMEASKKLNLELLREYNSFSTGTIKEKLLILKELYKTDIGFEYLKIEQGTKVILKIPFTE